MRRMALLALAAGDYEVTLKTSRKDYDKSAFMLYASPAKNAPKGPQPHRKWATPKKLAR